MLDRIAITNADHIEAPDLNVLDKIAAGYRKSP
jgi:hypothetical protein